MKQQLTLLLCLLIVGDIFGQVGIGTSNPTAQLEISTTNNGVPPLELNPQTSPIGNAAGQIAVIGDQLYLYDNIRAKWLSVASSTYNFGREGSLNNDELEYAGDITNSGPNMLFEGTIVYATLNSSGGNPTKGITLNIYDSDDNLESSHSFNLVGGQLIISDLDVNFSPGDYFIVSVDGGGGTNVDDVSMVLWTKRRQ